VIFKDKKIIRKNERKSLERMSFDEYGCAKN